MSYPRIRELREDADLSIRKICQILYMHKTTYYNYETGLREIPLNIAVMLAKHYNVSVDYIAGLEKERRLPYVGKEQHKSE